MFTYDSYILKGKPMYRIWKGNKEKYLGERRSLKSAKAYIKELEKLHERDKERR